MGEPLSLHKRSTLSSRLSKSRKQQPSSEQKALSTMKDNEARENMGWLWLLTSLFALFLFRRVLWILVGIRPASMILLGIFPVTTLRFASILLCQDKLCFLEVFLSLRAKKLWPSFLRQEVPETAVMNRSIQVKSVHSHDSVHFKAPIL